MLPLKIISVSARYITRTRCSKPSFSKNYSKDIVNIHNYRSQWDDKVKLLLKRYEDLFGITRLTEMHEKVLQVQSRMQNVQEKRRKIQEEMFSVQAKLQEIQAKLEKTSRGDEMFISIITQEHELLKEQKRLQNLLSLYDQTEREEQTALALAINNSQDHEKTYREKNKYLSLITGVIGGLIGLIGSSVNNWRHKKDIKSFANDISNLIKEQNFEFNNKTVHSDFIRDISNLNKSVEKLNMTFSTDQDLVNLCKKLEQKTQNLLSVINAQDTALNNAVESIYSFLTGKSDNYNSAEDFYSDLHMKQILLQVDEKFNDKFESQHSINSSLFGGLLLLTAFVIYFSTNK